MTELETKINNEEMTRAIVHMMVHRMTPLQYIFLGRWWTKKYDESCKKLIQLQKELIKEQL